MPITIPESWRQGKNRRENDSAILHFLQSLAVVQDDRIQKRLLKEVISGYVLLEKKVDDLLKNTLPAMVAEEIKSSGRFTPRAYDCTILFSDIVNFTGLAENISGDKLIDQLDIICRGMDDLVARFGGTKIKTIGDAYMAVFGAPQACQDHAVMALKTALASLRLMETFNRRHGQDLGVRIGVHTGSVTAGVVGRERMQFDIFGDNVNIAARYEAAGMRGRVNVSHETYLRTRDFFTFEERGEIALKHKGRMKAYFVVGERS